MNWNISEWAIRRPVPTLVLFLVLTLSGWLSFTQLGIDANPNIDIPAVIVTVNQLGAGPEEMETQITKKVEDAVSGLGNIDNVSSTVTDGNSTTVISFDLGVDTEQATNDVRDAVTRVRDDLPQDAQEPQVRRLKFEGGPFLTYTVSSATRSVENLSDLVDRTIATELLSVKGVAQVQRFGGVDREIIVDLDPNELDALGITATQVNEQVRRSNINLPGGRSNILGQEQGIRTLGSAATVEMLQSLGVNLPDGGTVPIQTLGRVHDDFGEARQSAYLDNQPVVSFSVFRSSGSLLVEVEDGVKDAIASLTDTLDDVQFDLIYTRATDVRNSYKASIESLIVGSILAVLVVGVFLRNWRTTLITATALPLSIIPTFLVLKYLDYTLNSMTLLALTLAVGNLVDDAIVEIENVERHIAMGKPPMRAAMDSTAEVGLAVVTTTATIVAVFLPVAFMGGVPGQFFQPFGVTVAVSTMFSTLVARLMTPMMAAYLLKPKPIDAQASHQSDGYRVGDIYVPKGLLPYFRLVRGALRHRVLTVGLAVGFFIASLMLSRFIPTSLFAAGDTGLSNLSIELPPGSTLAKTELVTQYISDQLKTHGAVDNVYVSQEPAQASAVARLQPKSQRVSREQFENDMRQMFKQIPGTRISFENQGGAGGGGKALEITLRSDNPAALKASSDALTQEIRQIAGLVEVSSSANLVKPEILIRPDAQRAADLGVTVRDIASTASLATLGDAESDLAEFDVGDRLIPIRVRLASEFRNDLSTLENLKVLNNRGQLVPLIAVADVDFGSGPAQVDRLDRSRQVTIGANLDGITLGQGLEQIYALPAFVNLPEGVSQQPSGDAEIMREVFSRFGIALATAIVMIYAVLVLLYNSFIYPFAVMVALPLCIGGALLGLMIAQKPLGLFALIGMVLLMGLVTKNSILLVDYALMAKAKGISLRQSVIEAGLTRLRPILMTSISTMAGMVPIAMEWGAGGETRSPMAIAVIGGFSTATLLTLVVVPVCFTLIAQFNDGIGSLLGRWTGLGNDRETGQPEPMTTGVK
ncbi:efflux RND transporter permease subunit [Leptothoe sp. PORK10 BA2]|uniref:efflux RND transporter permease subunit n=1 Tax=Leptothoe sp. PORK10 BA2 TaxID=3110254 RepID=UPI002B21AEC0|nr:efflux RND transporter permease subunit [Leptothoe sp. PORK10 BA2]MEA5465679.1 efflux RND transporter permease subunit [Leptothoe sp. PORK10 BA2]